jgi:hypothetical protein
MPGLINVKLREEGKPKEHSSNDRHIEGRFCSHDSDESQSGWAIRTWTTPHGKFYWPSEFHWIGVDRKIYRMAGKPVDGKCARQIDEDKPFDASRKAFIVETLDAWEAARFS